MRLISANGMPAPVPQAAEPGLEGRIDGRRLGPDRRDRLAGEVVGRRTEATGRHDEVDPAERDPEGVLDRCPAIGHGRQAADLDAGRHQRPGQLARVRVAGLAAGDLGADREDLGAGEPPVRVRRGSVHGPSVPHPTRASTAGSIVGQVPAGTCGQVRPTVAGPSLLRTGGSATAFAGPPDHNGVVMTSADRSGFSEFDRLLELVRSTRLVLHSVLGAGELPVGGADFLAQATLPHVEAIEAGVRGWVRADMAGVDEQRFLLLQFAESRVTPPETPAEAAGGVVRGASASASGARSWAAGWRRPMRSRSSPCPTPGSCSPSCPGCPRRRCASRRVDPPTPTSRRRAGRPSWSSGSRSSSASCGGSPAAGRSGRWIRPSAGPTASSTPRSGSAAGRSRRWPDRRWYHRAVPAEPARSPVPWTTCRPSPIRPVRIPRRPNRSSDPRSPPPTPRPAPARPRPVRRRARRLRPPPALGPARARPTWVAPAATIRRRHRARARRATAAGRQGPRPPPGPA